MSAAKRTENREVIPRWRGLASTAAHLELASTDAHAPVVPEPSATNDEILRERARDFRASRTLSFAADLLSASLVLGPVPDTMVAAELILKDDRSSDMVRATARSVVSSAESEQSSMPAGVAQGPDHDRREIRRLRRGLRANPRSAIRWAEMARYYTNGGQVTKALNAMRLAVAMAPTDRYVLRCAARLSIHDNDPEAALRTLAQAKSAMLSDPWLLASELAISAVAGRSSRHVKHARSMLASGAHSPFARSELTSALATMELHAGDSRRARRLFNAALVDPNENSVAQAEWASKHIAGLTLAEEQVERSPEALATETAETDDIDATLRATWEWLLDQPFSAHPAIFGSYHASKFMQFEEGERLAAHGLRANPRDSLLLNNRAFCLAALGRWAEAESILTDVDQVAPASERPTITATRGLIRFRAGDAAEGRRLYHEAIARMDDDPPTKIRAQIMLASEELRAGGGGMVAEVERLIEAIMATTDRDLKCWVAFIPRGRNS